MAAQQITRVVSKFNTNELQTCKKGKTMDYPFVKVEIKERVALITIDRQESMNALNCEVLSSLDKAFASLGKEVRAVILTGAGKAFVAGADIKEFAEYTPQQAREFSLLGSRIAAAIENFRGPVIAAINGFALGGGCELALACDMRIASDKAKLGQPEVNLGVIPGFGGTQRLSRIVGMSQAKYLVLTGEIIKADKALTLRLVDEVVAPEKLLERCFEIAKLIASKAPIAVAYAKEAINYGAECDLSHALAYETEVFAQLYATYDQREGCKAFIEKREAKFENR
jgi:enoyl-CoA hydratase